MVVQSSISTLARRTYYSEALSDKLDFAASSLTNHSSFGQYGLHRLIIRMGYLENTLVIYHVKEFDWNLCKMLLKCISTGKAIVQATYPAVLAA